MRYEDVFDKLENLVKTLRNFKSLLKINTEYCTEALMKDKQYSTSDQRPFAHKSRITLKRAVSDKKTGKTHAYEVHEEKADGSKKIHENVPYTHLDQAMYEGEGRLRMAGEKSTKKHALHHSAIVEHRTRTVYGASGASTPKHMMLLHPEGEPHTPKREK